MKPAAVYNLTLALLVTALCAPVAGCSIRTAPDDPLAALREAAGLPEPQSREIATDLDLHVGWVRGGETRVGNLFSDAFAWGAGAQIGFVAGGNIRDDRTLADGTPVTRLKKGIVSGEEFLAVLPFNADIHLVRLQAYRLKQNLEASVNKLSTDLYADGADDFDVDGAQHGDSYYDSGITGSGRFLHLSSMLKVEIDVNNQVQVVEDLSSGEKTDLRVTTPGRRIVRIVFDDVEIYANDTGNASSGWSGGSESCSFKGTVFSESAACTYFTAAIGDFQALGGDDHPAFEPSLSEVGNDGSVQLLKVFSNADIQMVTDYIGFLNRTFLETKPQVEGRITFR